MKITAVESIRLKDFANSIWVEIHTDAGLVGLGETHFAVAPIETWVHDWAAPYLLGQDPLAIERHNRHFLTFYLGFASTGMEVRGASAIDITLWDILGQDTGKSICQLLGGASRERIRIYNTCAGYHYMREKPEQSVSNWGLGGKADPRHPYEDLDAFLNRAGELAESLIAEGYQGMKIWPFDPYAEASNGTHISADELKVALAPFEKIRKAVGDRIDIHVEFHSLWNLPMAIRLAKALDAEVHVVTAFEPARGTKIRGAPEGAAKFWGPLTNDVARSTIDDAAASIRPMSIAPESPMKIRAGWKLCGRKPRHAPATRAAISVGG